MRARFNPKNPHKYVGNITNICARSSWEIRVMTFLDTSPSVLKWCSEEIGIQYYNPVKRKLATYYPDFFVIFQDKDGNQRKWIVEVKPLKESPLIQEGQHGNTLIIDPNATDRDKLVQLVNHAKWEAARAFALSKGAEFKILTEVDLFKGQQPKRRTRKKK